MPSFTKRRLGVGSGSASKGSSSSTPGPRSPSRPGRSPGPASRTSPTSSRPPNAGNTTTTTATAAAAAAAAQVIAPPPRVALSGPSSSSDNPPNANANSNAANRSPSPSPSPSSSSLAPPAGSAPTVAALQSALRDRDARIADLERELATMESEFRAALDQVSRAESETAVFWQRRCDALEGQVASLQRRLAGQHGQQGERVNGAGDGDGGGRADRHKDDKDKDREKHKEILEQKDDEIARLRAQVKGLKEFVSVNTRPDGEAQTSDEVFGERMARLGNGLQNWVLVNFRRARVDLAGLDDSTTSELARLVPMYQELASASKIHLLQSLVSRVLVELVFEPYFAGLSPDVADQIQRVEAFLASAASPESANRWRSFTLSVVRKDAAETLRSETAVIVDAVVARVNRLLDAITHTTATDARDQALKTLVAGAVDLAQLLAVQKAAFHVEFPGGSDPKQPATFDAETMEDVGGEEDDDDGGNSGNRTVWCVAFPALTKRGDECGAHLDRYRNVIAKAKVLCHPKE